MACECETCKYIHKIQAVMAKLGPEDAETIDDLLLRYVHADEDSVVNMEMLRGRWDGHAGLLYGAS